MNFEQAERADLVNRIRLAPNSQWMHRYFDLVKQVIEVTGLSDDDSRLALTVPKRSGYWCFLPININNRYVLNVLNEDPEWSIDLLCSYHLRNRLDLHDGLIFQCGALASERWQVVPPPILVRLNGFDIPQELREDWHYNLRAETARAKGSPYRRSHRSSVFKAATDLKYRAVLLRDAFAHEG